MFLNKCPTKMCLAKKKRKKQSLCELFLPTFICKKQPSRQKFGNFKPACFYLILLVLRVPLERCRRSKVFSPSPLPPLCFSSFSGKGQGSNQSGTVHIFVSYLRILRIVV